MSGALYESFDNGVGALNHIWGSGIDTSVPGQVTLTGDAGIMESPWGAAAGHGYGVYSVTASLHGSGQGPAVLLWPGNDVWPGPELDLVELNGNAAYGTLHYRGADGSDVYGNIYYSGLDASKTHTYTLDWEPGSVTFSVDGHVYGGYTDNVGLDFAHGGLNEVIGIMNQNRGNNTSVTVYDVSYTPSGAGGGSAVQAPVTTSGSSTTDTSAAAALTVASTASTTATTSTDSTATTTAGHPDTSAFANLPGWMWPDWARWWDHPTTDYAFS